MKNTKKFEEMAIASSQLLTERDYWRNQMGGEWEKVHFPYDSCGQPYREEVPGETAPLTFTITDNLAARLLHLSGNSDPRLHIILTTVVFGLLYHCTGSRDIILGTTITRQPVQGEFINTILPLRSQIDCRSTFKELLLQSRQIITGAYEHQNYPLETLLYELNLPFSEKDFPLFDTVVLLENIHDRTYLQSLQPGIIFSFRRNGNIVDGTIEYRSSFYLKDTIETIKNRFITVLAQALINPDTRLMDIDILAEEEREQLLNVFNDTAGSYPQDKTLHGWLEECARQNPDRVALVWEDQRLSLGELNERADRLAFILRKKAVGPDIPVAIMADISLEMVIGAIAVLKSGSAFLPLDPDSPPERVGYILKDSCCPILLVHFVSREQCSCCKPVVPVLPFVQVINLEDPVPPPPGGTTPAKFENSANLAYVIYTSGSTGRPKGVMIRHRNIVNQLYGLGKKHFSAPGFHHVLLAPFTFDPAVQQIFLPLLTGGTLLLAAKTVKSDPGKLLSLVADFCLDVVNTVPTLMAVLIDGIANFPGKPFRFRYIILAGEVFPLALYRKLESSGCVKTIINIYGPAEATINTTLYESTSQHAAICTAVPIGKPLMNYRVYILDPHLNPLPPGIPGELYIGGEGLAMGYINNPALTAEKFILPSATRDLFVKRSLDPQKLLFNHHSSLTTHHSPLTTHHSPLYKTGDTARWLADGNIEFTGRLDHQIKIRGMRVELEEIENRLMQHQYILEAVVITREDKKENKYLCAFIVSSPACNDEQGPDIPGIRSYLQEYLPDYMVPTHYIRLNKIPRTSSGKIDRPALLEIAVARGMEAEGDTGGAAPRDEIEEKLVEIWKNELQLKKVGIRDNYFNIGGDSIKSMGMLNLLNGEFNVSLEVAEFFTYNTIEMLAQRIKEHGEESKKFEESKRKKERQEIKQRAAGEIEIIKKTVLAAHPAPETVEDVYPMSNIQKGMIYYYFKDPNRQVYHYQAVYQVAYPGFDPLLFEKAVALIVEKNVMLRTIFNLYDFEEPVSLVQKKVPISVPHFDITHLDKGDAERHIKDIMERDRQKPFEIPGAEPLWRLTTFAVTGGRIVIFWSSHHAIMDGWSRATMFTELNNIYLKLKKDPDFLPQGLKCSYKESIIDEIMEKKNMETIDFWSNELSGYRRLKFPVPGKIDGGTGFTVKFRRNLGSMRLQKLKAAAEQYGSTIKQLCFAAYFFVMNMLSEGDDIVVGLITHNRPLCEDGDKVLGCFLNTLPVRLKIPFHENITWRDYIRLVDKKMTELKKYERISLFEIVHIIGEKSGNTNPLLDTVFNFVDFHIFQEVDIAETIIPGHDSTEPDLFLEGYGHTNTPLNFYASTTFGSFAFGIDYKDTVFDEEFIRQLYEHFQWVLDQLIDEPGCQARKERLFMPGNERQLPVESDRDRCVEAARPLPQPPADEIENTLTTLWADILEVDPGSLDVNADFFDLTGHSLNVIMLVSRIFKHLGVKVPLPEVYTRATIRRLADYIKSAVEKPFTGVEPVEEKEYYTLSPSQERFFFMQQLDLTSTAYNTPEVIEIHEKPVKEKLTEAFRQLIKNHEILRTSFQLIGNRPVQKIHPYDERNFRLEYRETGEEALQETIDNSIKPFDLAKPPLLRVGLVAAGKRHLLVVDIHHIISDAISRLKLLSDFMALYRGESLSPQRLRYKDYSEWLTGETQRENIRAQGRYWQDLFKNGVPILPLPYDYPTPKVRSSAGATLVFALSPAQAAGLKELALTEEKSLYMILFCLYYILLWKLTGQDDIVVGTAVSGRRHADLIDVIGLFFNTIPLRHQVREEETFSCYLSSFYHTALSAFDNQDYPLDRLLEDLGNASLITRGTGDNPLFKTMFSMQHFGNFSSNLPELRKIGLNIIPGGYHTNTARSDLFFITAEAENTIWVTVEYAAAVFKKSTIEKIQKYYLEIIDRVLENKELPLKNLHLSSELLMIEEQVNPGEFVEFGF